MRRRLPSHAAVVALLVLSALHLDPIPEVSAAPEPSRTPAPLVTNPLPRGDEGRDPIAIPLPGTPLPAPLPTPVYVDPSATPLAGPTDTPEPPGVPSNVGGLLPKGPEPPASLVWPLIGPITTAYSAAHPAVDIAAVYGAPVVAPAAGTITFSGWGENGGGYQVHIDHGWGISGLHHLSALALSAGAYVTAGTVVGWVGCTGICTGPHVHFNLLVDGAYRNPLAYLP